MSRLSLDFLTVHFGHGQWTRLLIDSIRDLQPNARIHVRKTHIVDNSRDGWIYQQLSERGDLVFHEFPEDLDQIRHYCHDHAASLSRGVEETDADILVILDCDAHLISASFLDYVAKTIVDKGHDAVAAPDFRYGDIGLSHPCFLVLTKRAREVPLPFDSRTVGSDRDVGRLVRQYLESRGLVIHVPKRDRAFSGACGEIFDSQVYHHGSGTFRHSEASEITKQVGPYARMFDRCVLHRRRFELSFWQRWLIRIHSRLRR